MYLLWKNIKIRRPNNKLDYIKLGLFKIKRCLGPLTFKLDLPKTLEIYPVFHKSLLESYYNLKARPRLVEINEETKESRYKIKTIKGYIESEG